MLVSTSKLPLLLAAVAGLSMAAVTAWQGLQFWQYEAAANTIATPANSSVARAGAPPAPDVDLAAVELFGQAGEAEALDQPDTENLPETNLRLFLRGVLAASGDFPGSALIEDEKRNTEAYLVGDELPGNATLRSVRADRVIIARGGALENLYFPEDEDRSGLSVASTGNSGESSPTETQTAPAQANVEDGQRREEIRRRLDQLRERLRNNN